MCVHYCRAIIYVLLTRSLVHYSYGSACNVVAACLPGMCLSHYTTAQDGGVNKMGLTDDAIKTFECITTKSEATV
jgi:hypothetical protein